MASAQRWQGGRGDGRGPAYELLACCGRKDRRAYYGSEEPQDASWFGQNGHAQHDANGWSRREPVVGASGMMVGAGLLALLGVGAAVLVFQRIAGSLSGMGGDPALAPEARPVEDLSAPPPPAALPGAGQDWSKGPPTIKFYMYRASSSSSFPLSNVNTGDLAGVMWYLHNEIVGSPHRKYGIDRIRRYKMTFRPVVEFWNVHHSNFAPFFAFDAAQCTSDDCEKIYSKYGFLSGCQPVTPGRSAYQSEANSLIPERCNDDPNGCRQPMWYSFPGPCPLKQLRKEQVDGHLNSRLSAKTEEEAKSDECIKTQPGGLCDEGDALGAPDCSFTAEEAGEILLDELTGIGDYETWWTSWQETQEYNVDHDVGIDCHFWDHRNDKEACAKRLKAAADMFEQQHGVDPDVLPLPVCDFLSWFDDEFDWPLNHTGGVKPEHGFQWKDGGSSTLV